MFNLQLRDRGKFQSLIDLFAAESPLALLQFNIKKAKDEFRKAIVMSAYYIRTDEEQKKRLKRKKKEVIKKRKEYAKHTLNLISNLPLVNRIQTAFFHPAFCFTIAFSKSTLY